MTIGEKIMRSIFETVRESFKRDGFCEPVLFLRVKDQMNVVPLRTMINDDLSKDRLSVAIRTVVDNMKADMVMLVLEGWYIDGDDSEKFMKDPDASTRPAHHPNRKEGVCMNLESTTEVLTGKANIFRGPDLKPYLANLVVSVPTESTGRFVNFFGGTK